MSLYTKKRDVDKHVRDVMSKIKSDNERKLKGFTFARMYHHVGDQRTALQYLCGYLAVRPDAAAAHKLRGQILAVDGQPATAIAAYSRALELDPHQKDLVMIGCKLLLELPPDPSRDQMWLQQATKYFPNDPIIFKLKKRALDKSLDGKSAEELEELVAAEISAEPGDVERHVRLCDLLRSRGRAPEALAYISRVERLRPFPRSVTWYQCVVDTCRDLDKDDLQDKVTLHTHHLWALDQLVSLGLEKRAPVSEVVTNLYRLDQLLYRAGRDLTVLSEEQARLEWRAFNSHVTGQLFYHLASVLLYTTQQGVGESRDVQDMALALMLTAQGFPPLQTVSKMYQTSERQDVLEVWRRRAAARLVEVGWSILAADRRGTHNRALTVQQQLCNQHGRSRVYNRVFGSASVSSLGQKSTSALLSLSAFLETNPTRPRPDELAQLCELAAPELSGSLQCVAWLRVHGAEPPPLAPQLQLSAADTTSAAPESLCRLDVAAFLEATVYTALQIRTAGGRDTESILPPSVAALLCTQDQAEWWSVVASLYGGAVAARELSSLRRTLQRGIETVRCLTGHGNSTRLLLRLADWALTQAGSVVAAECEVYQTRAELYFRAAVQQLDSIRCRVPPPAPPKQRLFDSLDTEPTAEEALPLLDMASRRLSSLLQRRGALQEALVLVRGLPSAEAAYQHGLVLRQLAEEVGSADHDQHQHLLRQAQEAFFLTLDRLRDPGCDAPPQLRDDLAAQLRDVEEMMDDAFNNSAGQMNGTSSLHVTLEEPTALGVAGSARRPHLAASTSTPLRGTPTRPSTVGPTPLTSRGTPANVARATTATSPLNLSSSFGQESRPSLDRVCAEVISLRSLLTERRDDDDSVWRRFSEDLRTALVSDVRLLITEELQQNRDRIHDLERQVSELRAKKSSQPPEPAVTAPAPAPIPPVIPPEMYGYMAALANMRGVPIMPMGMPMAYPAAAYQGLSLQDSIQDPLASQMSQAGMSVPPAPPALVAPLATPTRAPGQLPAVGQPGPLGTPLLSGQLGTPTLSGQLSAPPLAGGRVTGLGQMVTPQPPAPASVGTPAFSFKPSATTEVSSATVMGAPANVTVSGREPLPPPVASGAVTPAPSVVVPKQHIKTPVVVTPAPAAVPGPGTGGGTGLRSPHQFQIQLPASAQIPVSSPLGDSNQPAFSSVSSLPNIPAPQYSAVSPLQPPGRANISGHSPGRQRLDSTGSFHEDPEYDPMSDFKPIVPLPEEVEVRTGEEGDEQLFGARCKLYRFVEADVEAEWKERGLGELRVLFREEDGRARLVMRREQTHKVCANHYLQPGMKLSMMPDQPRAFIWAAQDFADEELKKERLCARFKTEELADQFKAAFEKAVNMVTNGSNKIEMSVQRSVIKPATPKPAASAAPDWATLASNSSTFTSTAVSSAATPGFTFGFAPTSAASSAASASTGFTFGLSTPASTAASTGFTFAGGASRVGAVGVGSMFGVVPTVVSSAGDEAADQDDDEYETYDEDEDEDESDEEESDDEPEGIACKPEFNFAGAGSGATFSFGFGGGGAMVDTSAIAPTASGGFTFGDKPPATETKFNFGLSKAAASTAATTSFTFAAPKLAVSPSDPPKAPQASAASATQSGVSLGGFSFTATPSVVKVSDPAPTAPNAAAVDSKPSPFAGFSFGAAAAGGQSPFVNSQMFGGANSSLNFATAAESGPGFKKDDSFKGFAGLGTPVFAGTAANRSRTGSTGEDANASEEYEPCAHFEPVVPLPELVELKTGEEAEQKLFGVRAKLYRRVDSEWKERGVGEMKILRSTATGRCRVLMRREQVLKLCANHALTADMKLNRLMTSDSAWVWSANDFAEGEANKEMFAVKFKTVEQANEFKEVFESCVAGDPKVGSSGVVKLATEAASKPAEATTPKPAAFTPKPAASTPKPATSTPKPGASTPKPGASASSTRCFSTLEPAGSASSGASTPWFVFGSDAGGSGQFSFSGVKPKSPVKPRSREISLNESAAEEDGYYEGDEGEHLLFEPVVPLPDKVEVVTGEEEEEVLYMHRSKLYRFDKPTGEWKERGLGDIKLLRKRDTGKVRLLMRREQVLKICLNHRLTQELEFTVRNENSVMWAATDYADPAQPKDEVFVARFKTPDIAAQFADAVKNAQERLVASPTKPSASTTKADTTSAGGEDSPAAELEDAAGVSASFTFQLRPDAGSAAATADAAEGDDDVLIVSELQPTPEQRAAAERLLLPAGFYLYQQRPPCPGCRGCRDQMPGEQTGTRHSSASSTASSSSAAGPTSSSAAGPTSSSAAGPTSSSAAGPTSSSAAGPRSSSAAGPTSSSAAGHTSASAAGPTSSSAAGPTSSSAAGPPSSAPSSTTSSGTTFSFGTFAFGGGQSSTGAQPPPKPTFSFGGSAAASPFNFTAVKSETASIFGDVASGKTETASVFGGTPSNAEPGSIFGGASSKVDSFFGEATKPPAESPKSIFGGAGSTIKPATLFGKSITENKPTGSVFGATSSDKPTASVFGSTSSENKPGRSIFGGGTEGKPTGSIFGSNTVSKPSGSIFGGNTESKPSGSIFGSNAESRPIGSIFGSNSESTPSGSIFGSNAESEPSGSIFGSNTESKPSGSIFGSNTESKPIGSIFGSNSESTPSVSIFGINAESKPSGSIFGGNTESKPSASIFGDNSKSKPSGSIFGSNTEGKHIGSVFGGLGTQSVFGGSGPISGSTTSGAVPISGGAPDKAASVFGGSNADGSGTGQHKSTNGQENVFGGTETNGVSGAPASTEAGKPTFGFRLQSSGSAVDFGAIAKSSEAFAKKGDPSFQFSGTGRAVFGSKPAASADDTVGSDDDTGGDTSTQHDPQFEPVVPLPELVEVRTGEEGETSVFCQRAILYRFTKDGSEWKERGRGEFKLLHNPTAGSYRVLLRRDQVHKLACNHRVTSDMSLSRLGSSTNAWVWSAIDYADEEPKPETLAVKFKTDDLADQYKQAFDSAVVRLKSGEAASEVASAPDAQTDSVAARLNSDEAAPAQTATAAPTSAPDAQTDSTEAEQPGEEGQQEEEAEEGEYEEDEAAMFEETATLQAQSRGGDWKVLGSGLLRVLYDGELFAAKVMLESLETGDVFCDNVITMQHSHQVDGSTVEWSAVDFASSETGERLTLRARLDSPAAADQLGRVMDEGVEYAVASGVSDLYFGEQEPDDD